MSRLSSWKAGKQSMSELAGRTFLVTGGNTGIGRATAAGLASRGGRVWIAARSRAKGEAAVAAIKAETGSDSVWFLPLDLADLDSVRACAVGLPGPGRAVARAGEQRRRGGARGPDQAGFRADVRDQSSRSFRADGRPARLPDRQRAGPGGDGVQRRPLLGQGHRLRGAAPAHARHHRDCASTRSPSCATCCSRRNSPAARRAPGSPRTRCTRGWWPPTSGGGCRGRSARS